jgi:hypothetical protein
MPIKKSIYPDTKICSFGESQAKQKERIYKQFMPEGAKWGVLDREKRHPNRTHSSLPVTEESRSA